MADDPMDSRKIKWAEMVPEVTFGTFPTNPAMQPLPGVLLEFNLKSSPVLDEYNCLKGAAETDPLSCGVATKTTETIEWDFKVKCTDAYGMLPQALLAATSSTYTPGNTMLPFSIGLMAGSQFCTLLGNVITEWVLEIPDNEKAAELSVSGMAVSKSAWGADYKGSGSHATAVSSADVLTMASLSAFTYDSVALSASDIMAPSLKFGVKNKVEPVIDASSSRTSKIGNWSFGPREYILELDATFLDDMGLQDDILAAADHTMAYTLDGKTWTWSGIKWANGGDITLNPEDVIGTTLQAAGGAARLSIA